MVEDFMEEGNEKSFVLLSLSCFSVIYVLVTCACKYVNQWDKTTVWSMMQTCAIKEINLLHGGGGGGGATQTCSQEDEAMVQGMAQT